MQLAYYGMVAAAIVVMSVALVLALKLRQIARGGYIGKIVNVLIVFIGFFFVAYAVAPFIPQIGEQYATILMAVVFLFGAVFVVLVLTLIRRLVQQIFDELEL